MGFYELWGSKWSPIVKCWYSASMLRFRSHNKLVYIECIRQQPWYDTDQILHMVTIMQLFALFLAFLDIGIIYYYFHQVVSWFKRGITTLYILHGIYNACLEI